MPTMLVVPRLVRHRLVLPIGISKSLMTTELAEHSLYSWKETTMVRSVIKKAIYRGGLLSVMHQIRNTSTLTVVLFHRVIPEGDSEWSTADPEWSVTTGFFEQCLKFFKKHYNVVGFPHVQESYAGGRPLPRRALLITFDDGWRNNLIHAAPILAEHDLPSLLFVTTGAIGKSVLSWQEILYGRWKMGDLTADDLNKLCRLLDFEWKEPVGSAAELARFVREVSELPLMQRTAAESLYHQWADEFPNAPHMMNAEELAKLQGFGFHLGTHGITHEPLTGVKDPMQELSQSRHDLHFAAKLDRLPESMSFPHGISTDELIRMAGNAGYESVFTGKKCLNGTSDDEGVNKLGRHNINQLQFQDPRGDLAPEQLAFQLFRGIILDMGLKCD